MIAVGTRFRGDETRNNALPPAKPLVQVDAEAAQAGRNYPVDLFLPGDARLVLEGLLARLPDRLATDATFLHDVPVARVTSEGALRATLGPYRVVADALLARVGPGRHP